jgi:hypothetical protein
VRIYACVNGTESDYSVTARLRQGQAPEVASKRISAQSDPVVVEAHGLTSCTDDSAAAGAGGATADRCVEVRFRDCSGSLLESLDTPVSSNMLLSSDDFAFTPAPTRSIPLNRESEPMTLPLADGTLPQSPRLSGVLSMAALPGADRCTWPIDTGGEE